MKHKKGSKGKAKDLKEKKPEKQPVVSSDENSSDEASKSSNDDGSDMMIQEYGSNGNKLDQESKWIGNSRLFSPFRSLGIVSDGPFHVMPHQNSANALATLAIGERFQILQCDRLQPVLVSQAVPASEKGKEHQQRISHIASDATLSVTVVAHGSKYESQQVTLYKRTQPISSMKITPSGGNWKIVELLHLGRIQMEMSGEKQGKMENVALCAAILSKGLKDDHGDGVIVQGSDSDDSESSESDSDDDSDDSDDDSNNKSTDKSMGQIVLLLASRTSLTLYKRIDLSSQPTFLPRSAVHPSTYVNKVLVGGYDSKTKKDMMILVNVKTGKLLHTFQCLPKSKESRSEITTLEQSPAIDTIAVGTSTGSVHLINARHDKLLFSVHHKAKSGRSVQVSSISFRTDGAAMQYGIAPMAVGRSDGTISIWDLTPPEEGMMGRTLLHEMEHVHFPGGVAKLQYMPQEPLLVSTGTTSNSCLMHVFDNPDHTGRLLRQRKGHTSAPKHIRYLHPGAGAGGGILANSSDGTDAAACQILSSGGSDRTFRLFSTVRSVLDKEYSQGSGLEKRAKSYGLTSKTDLLLPKLTAMCTCESRSRDWGDVVTIHEDHAFAYVWSSKRGAQSGPVLRQEGWNISAMKRPPAETTHATSVAISSCGNFALVGTKGGTIYKYNVQSGNARGSYPLTNNDKGDSKKMVAGDVKRTIQVLEKKMKKSTRAANTDKHEQDLVTQNKLRQRKKAKLRLASHAGFAVTGIAVDSVNRTVISVGADSKLIMWNFATHGPHRKSPYMLPAPATKMCHVRDSDLAAIALADHTTVLFDCSNLAIVRQFGKGDLSPGHTAPITDLGFSPDGRTLYTASLDSTIRVWDVPTNSCVDWLAFKSAPTSLTVSPTGEFLATTHTGRIGISLWSDRSFYQTVHLDGAQAMTSPAQMDDPVPISEVADEGESDVDPTATSSGVTIAKSQMEDEEIPQFPVSSKEMGLITMSGLPPAHWKNLFHLELVKQRNKPKEAPKKPPSAPFFLQWRPSQTETSAEIVPAETEGETPKADEEEWNAAWSDDDDGADGESSFVVPAEDKAAKRSLDDENDKLQEATLNKTKKRRVTHHRSHLAALLHQCTSRLVPAGENRFQPVSDHVASLGPSAIDVALSTLCNGLHDLEEGLPLLTLASSWLLEAVRSRERFEAVNAYLHRFLHIHASVITGIDAFAKTQDEASEAQMKDSDESVAGRNEREELLRQVIELRRVQKESTDLLYGKMQSSLCLLRHFSRMV